MLHLISKYKTELMGFAIVWVVLFHSNIKTPYLEAFTALGYGGVDIFFFLSGYGLYFSSVKNESLLSFYKKRFIRVFPTYAVVVFFMMLGLGMFTLKTYLINISTLGYWINESYFEWYIPALFAFYLWFPLLVKGINTFPYLTLFLGVALTAVLVYLNIHFHFHALLFPFIARIPIFMIGILFGKYTYEKKQPRWINPISLYGTTVLGLVLLMFVKHTYSGWLWYYGLYWFPFIAITPGLCLSLSTVLEKFKPTYLLRILSFLGGLSLEIYLLHIKPYGKAAELATYWGTSKEIVLCLIIALVIPIAYALSKGIATLVEYTERRLGKAND